MKTCLIVDDAKIVRKAVRRIIEELGFTALEAENGQEALNECAKAKPDFILLDWNMPVMDGMEFLAKFREDPSNNNIPVIVCTTENELAKIQTAISTGANEYIMKPFDKDIIQGKLQQTGVIN